MCLFAHSFAQPSASGGVLATPMPGLNDAEGAWVPESLPPVVDAHVHLFPDGLFDAIWRWFDEWGWPIRYKLHTERVIEFMLQHGVRHLVALHYAHKPGIARQLNRYMSEVCAAHPEVTGLATVFPGEPDAGAILDQAFAMGLAGVKLHCHVQCFSPDDPQMDAVYERCVAHDKPLLVHAGREPKSPGYRCDPHALCSVDRIATVLRSYPRLRVCVPHLGADEYAGYGALLERFDNLWLDTTMMLADYFPDEVPWDWLEACKERVLYGSDFPNLPYAWDRELRRIAARRLSDDALERVLGRTARELYALPEPAAKDSYTEGGSHVSG